MSDVCFINDHVAYASSNKTKSFEWRTNSFFFITRNKECHFSDVTKSSRVWRKVPESDARRVGTDKTVEAT